MEHVQGKSINLAMSVRGIAALNQIDLGKHVAEEYGIPMNARMIHKPDGETYPVPYGKQGQCIYSVGKLVSLKIMAVLLDNPEGNMHLSFVH